MIDINWNPSKRELRQFAGLLVVFTAGVGAYMRYAHGSETGSVVVWCLGAVLGIPGLLAPALLRPVFIGWTLLAFPIGWTISHLLLGFIYYAVLTPIGLILRLTGSDPMQRRYDSGAETYWIPHEQRKDVSSYFRQY